MENDPIDDADVIGGHSAPEIENHVGVVNDTYYNINKLVAGVDVDNVYQYSDTSNVVTVQPKSTDVSFSKRILGGGGLISAVLKVTDSEDKVVAQWVSTKEDFILHLAEGKYTMTEVVAPEGYYCVTTKMNFEIKDGEAYLLTAEVDANGRLTLMEGNKIVLEDAPVVQGEYEPPKEGEKVLGEYEDEIKGVNTGDNTLIVIWIFTLILSISAIAIALIRRRKEVR